MARELGELVEEEHAVVGQRDLAGARDGAAAEQRGGADGVVRSELGSGLIIPSDYNLPSEKTDEIENKK